MPASRNFDGPDEISHRKTLIGHKDHAMFMMGYLQCLRDGISKKYGKDVPLFITSGDRTGYNQNLVQTQNAAPNSFHIWRNEMYGKRAQLVVACDLTTTAMSPQALYNEIHPRVRGEVYWKKSEKIVHIAPFGVDEHFVMEPNGDTSGYVKGKLQ